MCVVDKDSHYSHSFFQDMLDLSYIVKTRLKTFTFRSENKTLLFSWALSFPFCAAHLLYPFVCITRVATTIYLPAIDRWFVGSFVRQVMSGVSIPFLHLLEFLFMYVNKHLNCGSCYSWHLMLEISTPSCQILPPMNIYSMC